MKQAHTVAFVQVVAFGETVCSVVILFVDAVAVQWQNEMMEAVGLNASQQS